VSLFDRLFSKTPQDWLRKAAKEEADFRQQRVGLLLGGAEALRTGYGSMPSQEDFQSLQRQYMENVIKFINKAIALDTNYAEAWYYKGYYLHKWYQKGKDAEALECIEKAIALSSQHADAWFCKAEILSNRGAEQQALLCFDKVIEINPKDAEAWWKKSVLLKRMGKKGEANSCHEKAVAIDSRYKQSSWSVPFRGLVRT